jgi:hypothetical protein
VKLGESCGQNHPYLQGFPCFPLDHPDPFFPGCGASWASGAMICRWAYHLPVLSVLVASTCLPGEELVDGVFLGLGLATSWYILVQHLRRATFTSGNINWGQWTWLWLVPADLRVDLKLATQVSFQETSTRILSKFCSRVWDSTKVHGLKLALFTFYCLFFGQFFGGPVCVCWWLYMAVKA